MAKKRIVPQWQKDIRRFLQAKEVVATLYSDAIGFRNFGYEYTVTYDGEIWTFDSPYCIYQTASYKKLTAIINNHII